MRNLIWIILLTFIACGSMKEDEKMINEVMQMQEQAWNNGDIEQFMQGYWQSDSLMFIGKNGIKYGWQTTLDNYKTSYPDKVAMGKLKFEIIKLEVNNDAAYMLGKWNLERREDNPNGYFTLYWKKIEGKWFITIDHTS
jgi:ketosteroid isomerase-like protein